MAGVSPATALQGAEVIRAALPLLPRSPGVYLMKDAQGKIIYVGKAKILRNRVASYVRQEEFPGYYRLRVQIMVSKVASVDWVMTASEKEALLLENTLIKRHRPRYNVDLRDDKNFLMFRLSLESQYPRLSIVRRRAQDGARYFGPFDRAGAARQTLRMLQQVFPLRRCSDHTLMNRVRPCLDFEMGKCAGPCTGQISQEEYQELARQLAAFFDGQGQEVAKAMERRMKEAAAAERFEEAAAYRDRWQALVRTLERQRVANTGERDLDALALHDEGDACRLGLLQVREGRVVGSQVHDLSHVALTPEEMMGQALLTLYHEGPIPPPLLLLSHLPEDPGLVVEVLGERAGRRVELRKPQRGDKKGLVDLALANAAQPRAERDTGQALTRLGAKLGLAEPPERMECVDISHLGGRLTVASLVAFKDGLPDKGGYRRYKVLTTTEGPDDYAAMAEVVGRRLAGESPLPELLLLDGGKGQLNAAQAALDQADPARRPFLAALAKGRGQGPDKVYVPGRKNPLSLSGRDPALLLLMRLRDEAHRFAITYHRLLRRKALTRSILEEVPGVGPAKAAKLLAGMGSLAALKKASAQNLVERCDIDLALAHRVQAFLAALDTASGPE